MGVLVGARKSRDGYRRRRVYARSMLMERSPKRRIAVQLLLSVGQRREDMFGASAMVFEGLTHPGCLEAIACREALALAADLHVGSVMVASDCLEVITGLQQQNLGLFSSVLREIKTDASRRGGVFFRHEGRGSNGEAHSLARLATSLPPGRHVWFSNPPEGLNFPVTISNS